jgi:hypothetical protein
VKKQVNIKAASEAEWLRWKAEAKRRGWTVTMLVRSAVNAVVDAAEDQREDLGLKGLR